MGCLKSSSIPRLDLILRTGAVIIMIDGLRHASCMPQCTAQVPEGYVGSTANQARTQTWDWTDTNGTNVLWAEDVVDFAVKKGLYPSTARKEDFSFSDIYNPLTFGSARLGTIYDVPLLSCANSITIENSTVH